MRGVARLTGGDDLGEVLAAGDLDPVPGGRLDPVPAHRDVRRTDGAGRRCRGHDHWTRRGCASGTRETQASRSVQGSRSEPGSRGRPQPRVRTQVPSPGRCDACQGPLSQTPTNVVPPRAKVRRLSTADVQRIANFYLARSGHPAWGRTNGPRSRDSRPAGRRRWCGRLGAASSSGVHRRRHDRPPPAPTFRGVQTTRPRSIYVNSSSLRRTALPAVAVLTVGLTLAACGNNNSSGSAQRWRHPQRWRRHLPGQRSDRPGAPTTRRPTAARSTTRRSAPAPASPNFTSKAYSFAGTRRLPDRRPDDRRQDLVRQRRGRGPGLRQPDRGGLQPQRRRLAEPRRARPSPTSSTARSPSGTTRRSPTQNPGVKLPSTAIATVHRSDDSGTTYNFTDYLSKASGGAWTDAASSRGRRA